MPGTGDVTYVLGPSLIALVLGILILVTVRALRRGPTVAARSAPDHGLQSTAEVSETDRLGEIREPTADAADGQRPHTRPSIPRPRTATRRMLSGR